MRTVTLLLLLAIAHFDAHTGELTPEEWNLLNTLPNQTGNTDGYSNAYNIDQHEPARSIIRLGAKAIPMLKIMLNDQNRSQAHWDGRSGSYTLTVGDVATCILQHVGGPEELKLLQRRQAWMEKVWREAREYKDEQHDWSDDEKTLYMSLFDSIYHGKVITLWAIQTLEKRLGKQPNQANFDQAEIASLEITKRIILSENFSRNTGSPTFMSQSITFDKALYVLGINEEDLRPIPSSSALGWHRAAVTDGCWVVVEYRSRKPGDAPSKESRVTVSVNPAYARPINLYVGMPVNCFVAAIGMLGDSKSVPPTSDAIGDVRRFVLPDGKLLEARTEHPVAKADQKPTVPRITSLRTGEGTWADLKEVTEVPIRQYRQKPKP